MNSGKHDLKKRGDTMCGAAWQDRRIFYLSFKRLFDIVVSACGIVILSPLLAVTAVCVRIDSKGPVFYLHRRIGRDGREYRMVKFRTMYADANDYKKYLSEEQMTRFHEKFKLEDDPRVTRVGRFLRKSSIDELPQLFNVLKGDMSLVGPRPIIRKELLRYGDDQAKLLSVTPGLTGYWQAYARNDVPYERRMEMELYYVDHASVGLDAKILLHTIPMVITQKGAA